jgi:hypothetical protein
MARQTQSRGLYQNISSFLTPAQFQQVIQAGLQHYGLGLGKQMGSGRTALATSQMGSSQRRSAPVNGRKRARRRTST